MVQSAARSVQDYIAGLPPERKAAVETVRKVIRRNLPKGFAEGMQYGMICYFVPLARYPDTYNGQPLGYFALASQKQYLSLYLHCVYMDAGQRAWFEREYKRSGKKLNMGKSCVRFRHVDDLPLELIGESVRRISLENFIAGYEAARRGAGNNRKTRATAVKEKAGAPARTRTRV